MKLYKVLILISILFSCENNKKKVSTTNSIEKAKEAIVEVAYKASALLGEGAIWNHKTQELYWIDIEGKSLNIFNPEKNSNKIIDVPSRIGTVVPSENGNPIIALEDGIHQLDLKTKKTMVFADMSDVLVGKRLNDGKCDPSGRLWVGSMHMEQKEGEAKLYEINSQGDVKMKIDSVTISNGIVWTKDKKTMYYIDTPTSEIKAYDYDDITSTITNQRIAVKIPESLGYPDGMTIDNEDMVWVGMWNGNAVIRFNPKTGEILKKIEVPAHNVTSCAFGGKNLDTLYITSATVDMTEEEKEKYPLSGSVFKIKTDVKGVKSNFFEPNLN